MLLWEKLQVTGSRYINLVNSDEETHPDEYSQNLENKIPMSMESSNLPLDCSKLSLHSKHSQYELVDGVYYA